MRVPQFLDLVPKAVKAGVFIIVGCALLIGVAVSIGGRNHGRISAHGASLSVLSAIAAKGLGFGLLAGVLVATWAVCLGYVYADAQRRVMPPILWTLVAALVPNLLGFLLYFASRRPIALPCPRCGQPITPGQRFCSWCGHQGSATVPNDTSAPAADSC
jgi:hypothetical protein